MSEPPIYNRTEETIEAERRVSAAIASEWICGDGPARAFLEWRRHRGSDGREVYEAWGITGPGRRDGQVPSTTNLELIVSWFPAAVTADAATRAITPETHVLVWRAPPEIAVSAEGKYALYARLAFMPKDAWFLELETDK